jgi:hypothetical protein
MSREYVSNFKEAAEKMGGKIAGAAKNMPKPKSALVEKRAGGFFTKVDLALAKAFELAHLFEKAEGREEKEALKETPAYMRKVTILEQELATFDARGFSFLRKKGIERVLENELPVGVVFFLDKETRRRFNAGEKDGNRHTYMPFVLPFKDALERLPLTARERYNIYPVISHGMFLRVSDALKAIGKYREAMVFSGKVPAKWRKPFETTPEKIITSKTLPEKTEAKTEV